MYIKDKKKYNSPLNLLFTRISQLSFPAPRAWIPLILQVPWEFEQEYRGISSALTLRSVLGVVSSSEVARGLEFREILLI